MKQKKRNKIMKQKVKKVQPWTSDEKINLLVLMLQGNSSDSIAEQMGRTSASIRNQANRLGVSFRL